MPSPSSKKKISIKCPERSPFYIVGMGGSAGGLEAFGQFFTNMPTDSGMAFVLVSHLDPTQKDMMPELLQRFTKMQVFQAKDGMEVCPNCVYVIPPNRDMSILHGTIQLLEMPSPRGLRLPIDFFFRHLAEDREEREERAVGIILSGMGTDGTLGIKAIKEKLGMVMAENPASAKYDGMPRSAVDTGLVDYIAPQNLIMDPPFTKLDLISCRNIMIYMMSELQKRLLLLLHYALNPGGLLFLGASETIGNLTDLFSSVDTKWRIFSRKESATARMDMVELPVSPLFDGEDKPQHAPKTRKNSENTLSDTVRRILLEHFTPPAVIINEKGDIVYISGRTGKYLEPAAGKTNINIFAMAREGLRSELEVCYPQGNYTEKNHNHEGFGGQDQR